MRIVQTVDGKWKLINGEFSAYFDTEAEAKTMEDKIIVIEQVQSLMGVLADIDDLNAYIVANEYGSGALNAITDEEAASVKGNLAAADIFNGFNLLLQLEILLTGAVPAPDNYMPVVDKVRGS